MADNQTDPRLQAGILMLQMIEDGGDWTDDLKKMRGHLWNQFNRILQEPPSHHYSVGSMARGFSANSERTTSVRLDGDMVARAVERAGIIDGPSIVVDTDTPAATDSSGA